jgi:hypothetical protein
MTFVRPTTRRRLLAGLVPLMLAAAALPLLAPTCGGGEEGWKTFSRSSLIIPMDRCYQYQTDGVTGTGQPSGCPQSAAAGDVIKAYGLVYQLVRNDVAVYWVIDPTKTALTAYDMSVQYDGGFPVLKYDWSTGAAGQSPTAEHLVRYMGGPFVVDGSDFAKASAVLQKYKGTFGAVNVHVSNVAFRGYVKKTMAGGWSAGGTVPPKLALLDIGSGNLRTSSPYMSDPKNAEPVIEGYLTKAGIGTGTAGGTATGTHGEIYDRLGIEDFQPASGSTDPRTSRLFTNGYQILWVPHWVAPGSCSDYTAHDGRSEEQNCYSSLYSTAKIDQVLKTIGVFAAGGKDVFAECAGMGSFEGVFNKGSTTTYTYDYKDGDPATRFQTLNGLRYNELPDVNSSQSGTQLPPASFLGSFSSPLMQLGDFPFRAVTGAIEDHRPQNATAGGGYHSDVVRLIAGQRSTATPELKTKYGDSFDIWDYFTLRPAGTGHGTIVYLSGHSYSGVQGSFQIAGSRLVLNTLFNLGAGCTESGVSCDTGKLGVCGKGTMTCSVSGQPVCAQTTLPSAEKCNGLDDDCDGAVDEDLEVSCYDGPAATRDVGLCRSGIRACERKTDGTYGMTACIGQTLPAEELCNALDDDCDNQIDENLQQACYSGPLSTVDFETGLPMGICKPGMQTCTTGSWGECKVCTTEIPGSPDYAKCQILPQVETCESGSTSDENCDGYVNEATGEGCGTCTPGEIAQCYSGPAGTDGIGLCEHGTQTCVASGAGGVWGPCLGQVVPRGEVCTPAGGTEADEDCDDQVDEGCGCLTGETESCYAGPAGTEGVGICLVGERTCVAGEFVGECSGQVLPAPETCDGVDNDCDGTPDDDALCANGFVCEHGVCVPSHCGVENMCPEGYDCTAGDADGTCVRGTCGGSVCPDGQACVYGGCLDSCPDDPADPRYVACGTGSICVSGGDGGGGVCTGGSCYFTGCPAGQLCLEGECAADPCQGVTCPSGTFCREGDCVQACTFVTCRSGEKCGTDGFCEHDPCAGKNCGSVGRCVSGSCVDDPCAGVGCGLGKAAVVSGDACVCIDNPCTGVVCPTGQCLGGQCFAAGNLKAVGSAGTTRSSGGCGTGSGSSSLAALLLLIVPLARRRRAPRAAGLALVLVATALLGSACNKGESKIDLSKCAVTCEGENRCIDVWTDPDNCGTCGYVCGEGEICVDQVCGPSSAVAPKITRVSPDSASRGALEPVQVELTGQRFKPGATLRMVSPAGTRTFDTQVVDAGRLVAELDLSDALATTAYLRVLNPDNVRSNSVPFDVTTPSPLITSIDPTSVLTGQVAEIKVLGTGFFDGSHCRVSGPNLTEQVIPTELDQDALLCTFDATTVLPGTGFEIRVVNDADPTPIVSGPVGFSVTSATPEIQDLSPNQGQPNEVVAFTVSGGGFDVTSVVLFDGDDDAAKVPTTFISATQLYVAQLSLVGKTSGPHTVTVRNGTALPYKFSNEVTFTVGTSTSQVTGLSPGSAYQGQTVTLTFSGSGFLPGTQIQLQPPSGPFETFTSSVNGGGTAVSASVNFTGRPEGSWLARLRYPDLSTSASYTFRVLSNTAILQSATPRGETQGKSVSVTLSAVNLRPSGSGPSYGIKVAFSGSGTELTPSNVNVTNAVSGAGTVTVSLSTVNLNTGTYSLQIRNPNGAALSNAISFNVTPGQPTLSSLTPPTASQAGVVEIKLTGTNFAKPDASGNGSVVRVSSTELGIVDHAIDSASTNVMSPTEIRVQFDTRDAVPCYPFDVSVWNPGGPTPPQKSNVLVDAFEVTSSSCP